MVSRAVLVSICGIFLLFSLSRISALFLYYRGSLELYRDIGGWEPA